MITYLSAFIFYTMAMVGILFIAFIIYKKTMVPNRIHANSSIKILDSTPIGNKKNLLIIKVNNEKFLIASGMEHTTFLAKLENSQEQEAKEIISQPIQEIPQEALIINEQQEKLNDIERQFKKLYSQNDEDYRRNYAMSKREMVKELLKELNETTNTKMESRF